MAREPSRDSPGLVSDKSVATGDDVVSTLALRVPNWKFKPTLNIRYFEPRRP